MQCPIPLLQHGGRPREPSCPGHPHRLVYYLLLFPRQTHLSGKIAEHNNYVRLLIYKEVYS